MRAVRFTTAEAEWLDGVLARHPAGPPGSKDFRTFASVTKKLSSAREAAPTGVNPGPLEQALMAAARGKVVPLASPAGWPRASRAATQVGATLDDARLVGEWMARQGWLQGPQTLLDVLNKWPQWLAKARATQPPPSAQPGFGDGVRRADAEAQRGTDGAGGPAPRGRAPSGLR